LSGTELERTGEQKQRGKFFSNDISVKWFLGLIKPIFIERKDLLLLLLLFIEPMAPHISKTQRLETFLDNIFYKNDIYTKKQCSRQV
jgi:hypothetical protein